MSQPLHSHVPADALSDAAAVERLFELVASGNDDAAELARLDALVYGRLLQAYASENSGAAPPRHAA